MIGRGSLRRLCGGSNDDHGLYVCVLACVGRMLVCAWRDAGREGGREGRCVFTCAERKGRNMRVR